MSEAIKLFGKTIFPLPPPFYLHEPLSNSSSSANESTGIVSDNFFDLTTCTSLHENESPMDQQGPELNRETSMKEMNDDKEEEEESTSNHDSEDLKDPTTSSSSEVYEKPKIFTAERETSPSKESSKNGEQQTETTTNNSQEKTLKKPDKIIPCPRCNSMDTKFCYYNNYNVNQPRHFCKNCQRYWTAGGTMRNVPVGAGRRKNKSSSSSSHYRQLIVSEALRTAQGHSVNGTVLNFGSDSPLCETVAAVLNISDKRNGFQRPEERILISCGRTAENGDDRLSGNSVTASNISQECFPGPTWPYQWNSTVATSPAFCPPGFPVSFYPAPAYWGCTVPNQWMASSLSCPPSPLGKHSREGNIINPGMLDEPSEGNVLVPKTLRIDDPAEAAKSSIWATLGIKNEKSNFNGRLFRSFQSKNDDINYEAEKKSSLLQANPAALSRSLNFHESS